MLARHCKAMHPLAGARRLCRQVNRFGRLVCASEMREADCMELRVVSQAASRAALVQQPWYEETVGSCVPQGPALQ